MFDNRRIKFYSIVWNDRDFLDPTSGKVVQRDFFDRRDEVSAVFSHLADPAARVIFLLGERRSGKSSAIRHIEYVLKRRDPNIGFRTINLTSTEEFSTVLLESIREYVISKVQTDLAINTIPIEPDDSPQELRNKISQMMFTIPNERLILAIDELDSILYEAKNAESIVSLVNALATDTTINIRLLVTMSQVPELLLGTFLESQLSHAVTLRPFPKEDMDEMVLKIVGDAQVLSKRDLQVIYEYSGGWPFYAKLLLMSMAELESGQEQLDQALVILSNSQYLTSPKRAIERMYDAHLDDNEKALILLLAEYDGHLTKTEMMLVGSAIQGAARKLSERDFVQMELDGGCRFRIGLLGSLVRSMTHFDLEVYRRIDELLLILSRNHNSSTNEDSAELTKW